MSKKFVFIKLDPIKPTIAFDTYWKFAVERQNIFFNKLNNVVPLTSDEILAKYKFTNPYRACDRVSQYLIGHVIYSADRFDYTDQFLRTLLFKLFNKIETWQFLEERFGPITRELDFRRVCSVLDLEMNRGRVLYSNAYMMASGSKEFDVTRKHHAHFLLLEMMLKDALPAKLVDCKNMHEGYELLLKYPLIGSFLAYQYVTDLNYSDIVNFKENEFTVPGPGARDGIRKCFSSLGGLSETDIIKMMYDRQDAEFERLGLRFQKLGKRELQYIDIQNIFCETDKYCRVAHPDIQGISGRTRIKQLYKPNALPIELKFPPKWKIQLGEKNGRKRLSGSSG